MLTKERQAELIETINSMQQISDEFYLKARCTDNHAFIEFTGILNEYIKICTQSLEKGIDFTRCNTHTGNKLHVKDYNLNYLLEKLNCIFDNCYEVNLNDTDERPV